MIDSFADAWCHGMIAGANGQPACDNPYPRGTQLAESWQAGRIMGQSLCPPSQLAEPQPESRERSEASSLAYVSRTGHRASPPFVELERPGAGAPRSAARALLV